MLPKDLQDFVFEGTDCFVVYGLCDRFYIDKDLYFMSARKNPAATQ